jgi:cytochrome c biogenesis protein CcdA/thiol-disulfide isomerase/thioredoxin
MTLAVLAFLGGALTILSPCILPVLPFVFARQNQPFLRGSLPLLAGMALTFAGLATLAAVGGAWAVHANAWGRLVALLLLAAFGVALLSKRVAEWLTAPLVSLGNRLSGTPGAESSVLLSVLLGVATGLLWAPCAGPILGLILTAAALGGATARTTLLLLAYAAGAGASLALATLAGTRIFAAMRSTLGTAEWLRRGLGVAVLTGVIAIGAGWDTGILTRLSAGSTNRIEQALLARLHPGAAAERSANAGAMMMTNAMAMSASAPPPGAAALPVEGELPPLSGAVAWLNSPPLTPAALRGKVVLIDFWTYSCINCLRTLPYLRGWYERYKDRGLVIIGVHAPEFAFEKDQDNVRRAVQQLGIRYPVAIDNDYAIWRAFDNQYWPAHYFIDAAGRIRAHHFGEGNYEQSEQLIRQLLDEASSQPLPAVAALGATTGVELAPDEDEVRSPETYVGYARAANFVSPVALKPDRSLAYSAPAALKLNQWSLAGSWSVGDEAARATASGARIVFRFHARDLHLVLAPAADGRPVRFRVTLDGQPPAGSHGADIDAAGEGVVREQRLYQLIRQATPIEDRTFSIEFLDAGVRAYSFTFG